MSVLRLTGQVTERSIAGQIEFWARLGRAIEPLLRGDKALALHRAGDSQALSECLHCVDSAAGRHEKKKTWISEDAGPTATVEGLLAVLPYFQIQPARVNIILGRIERAIHIL